MNDFFTIPEENLICIYKTDSRNNTIEHIRAAIPYMDGEMKDLADGVIRKLQGMSDGAFSETRFVFTDSE